MKKNSIFTLVVMMLLCIFPSCTKVYTDVTIISQIDYTTTHTIGIVAHRGYWNCSEGGYAENSVASLRSAQQYGFWGSEFDVHLTTDDVIVVYHNDEINGMRIDESSYSEIMDYTLKNGEKLPTLDNFLEQALKNPKVVLVCEFKSQSNTSREDRLVDLTVEKLKGYGLYDPNRVAFISASKHVCDYVALTMPEFSNQYINGDYGPDELVEAGINGIDYQYSILISHPDWCETAHSLGMSVNCWTVDNSDNIQSAVELGVDYITTNVPETAREVLRKLDVNEK